MNRRKFLTSSSIVATTALAGCSSVRSESTDSDVVEPIQWNPSVTTYIDDHRIADGAGTIRLTGVGPLILETLSPVAPGEKLTGGLENHYDPIDIPDEKYIACMRVGVENHNVPREREWVLPPFEAWSLFYDAEEGVGEALPLQTEIGGATRYIFRDDDGGLNSVFAYSTETGESRSFLAFVIDRDQDDIRLEYDPVGVGEEFEWSNDHAFEFTIPLE